MLTGLSLIVVIFGFLVYSLSYNHILNNNPEQANQIQLISLLIGGFAFIVLVVSSVILPYPFLVIFKSFPSLTDVLTMLGIGFFVNGIQIAARSGREREIKQFKKAWKTQNLSLASGGFAFILVLLSQILNRLTYHIWPF